MIIEIYNGEENHLYTVSTKWFSYDYTTKTLSFINCIKCGAGYLEHLEIIKLSSFYVAPGETLAVANLDKNSEIPTL